MSDKNTTLHVVVAVRGPKPKFMPISKAIPRAKAIEMVKAEWKKGVMARLHPPLGKPKPANLVVVKSSA